MPYQFIFELKYLKKNQLGQLDVVRTEAVTQLEEYFKDDKIGGLVNRY